MTSAELLKHMIAESNNGELQTKVGNNFALWWGKKK
jgi:hypothetical protein